MRALLGTAAHFCKVVVLKLRTVVWEQVVLLILLFLVMNLVLSAVCLKLHLTALRGDQCG